MRNILIALLALVAGGALAAGRPNVLVVITDDQGYGDLSGAGNPIVRTPHIDRFAEDSIRLTNYHVDPTCSPTRAALMTGRYSDRVGVWHTLQGRSLLRARETTIADVFEDNHYATGFFGKWHLGDAYPFRPEDRGFQHVVMHGSGGVGQIADYWGNDYFNDTYYVNGTWTRFNGFCTDIWFTEAQKFMQVCKANKKPFFIYLSTNAPHQPLRAPQKYLDQYLHRPDLQDKQDVVPFYGMISNIDDNFGTLQTFLQDEGLAEDTILVFTTDNGTSKGSKVFNAGMRGGKGSAFDGGHRVPFFLQWPGGKLGGGRDIDQLTAHLDVLPTLIDLLKLNAPAIEFDGTSLVELLHGDQDKLRDRTLVVESQRILNPEKWRGCSVMHRNWRLQGGKQLYDLKTDPGQTTDVARQHPELVEQLRGEYEAFWASVSQDHHIISRCALGAEEQNPTTLTAMDHMTQKAFPAFNHGGVQNKGPYEAPLMVNVERDGNYEISIRRWPAEYNQAINFHNNAKKALGAETAYLEIGNVALEQAIPEGAEEVTFKVKLPAGPAALNTGFISATGERAASMYTYVLNTDMSTGNRDGWQTPAGLGLPLVNPEDLRHKDVPPILNKLGKGHKNVE